MKNKLSSFLKGTSCGIAVATLFDFVSYYIPSLKRRFWDEPPLLYGLHFHHSLVGLLLIICGAMCILGAKTKQTGLLLIGFGLGIILVHTITDGRLIFLG